MDVSIIIVSYNNFNLLKQCIASIIKYTKRNSYELIVIDNNSSEGDVTVELSSYSNIKFIKNNRNVGFAAANNQGISVATGKYFLFLNNDTQFIEDSISLIFEFCEKNDKNIFIGCELLNIDRTHQNSVVDFDSAANIFGAAFFLYLLFPKSKLLNKYHNNYRTLNQPTSVDFVAGAFIFGKSSDFKKCSGFDERFFFYSEEADLCYRFIKEFSGDVVYFPSTSVIHAHGATTMQNPWFKYFNQAKAKIQFYQKHYHGFYFVLIIVFHYLSLITRSIIYFFGGIVTFNSKLIRKSFLFIKQLFVYPKNLFYLDD